MNKNTLAAFTFFSLLLLLTTVCSAITLKMPSSDTDIVGANHEVTAKHGDTLASIGHRWNVGFCEMAKANPGIGNKTIPSRKIIIIPTRYVLPPGPRKGIVVNLAEHRLYYYFTDDDGIKKVMTFPVAIGRQGWQTPTMESYVSSKTPNPSWIVPESIKQAALKQGKTLPNVLPPGPNNPLGQYKMRLGSTSYLIHGTNNPDSVGKSVSSGCLRMYAKDINALYNKVPSKTPVRIVNYDHNKPMPKAVSIGHLKNLVNTVADRAEHRNR